jgi:hypothetical protein
MKSPQVSDHADTVETFGPTKGTAVFQVWLDLIVRR